MIRPTTMGAVSRWPRILGCLATDRRLLISALCLVSAIRLGLWLLPVRTVGRLVGRLGACRNNAGRARPTSRPSHLRADLAHASSESGRRTGPLRGGDPTFSGGHDFSDRLLAQRKPRRITDSSFPDRAARAVRRVSRVVPGATCLTQALAVQAFLERRGLPTRLHIGVRDSGEAVRAHAWLDSQGMTVIGGAPSGQWTPLLTIEGARAWSSPRPRSG
jgi:hypothetical protein